MRNPTPESGTVPVRARGGLRLRWRMAAALLLLVVLTAADAMNLNQAIRKVQRETGGKVLSAQTRVERNREMHEIRVLTPDGRVRRITVPGDPVKKKKDKPDARADR